MRGLDPRTHVFATSKEVKAWVAGSSPAMTNRGWEFSAYSKFSPA